MKSVIHRWVRQPNLNSGAYNRIANRYDPFENTLTVLEDPKNNRKLYLIGTANSSTALAYRTKKLIQQITPNSVYVQATPQWWNYAKHTDVTNQQDFTAVSQAFVKEKSKIRNNIRGILWRMRLNSWLSTMRVLSRFPSDFKPFTPGLQTKFALEEAERLGAETIFGGQQIDGQAISALHHEPNMYSITPIWNMRKLLRFQSTWAHAYWDFIQTLQTRGGQAFSQSIDRSRINFVVSVFNRLAPLQKKILVDWRDERIFRELYSTKGQNVVAVVNQWHMQGIETHWRRATNTQLVQEKVSPVADMDIDAIQENSVVNEYLREFRSKNSKSEPATHQNHLINYHKQNFEYERTRHTHHESHEDVPEPGQEHTHKKHH